jgi:hypothetical protein
MSTNTTALKRRIIALRKRGKSYFEIMAQLGCSEAWVFRVLREAGLVKARKKAKAKKKKTKATQRRNRG